MFNDVTVVRCAECWTDHKLLRAQLQLKLPSKVPKGKTRRRFTVASLHNDNMRQEYTTCESEVVDGKWSNEADGEMKWEMIKRRKIVVT